MPASKRFSCLRAQHVHTCRTTGKWKIGVEALRRAGQERPASASNAGDDQSIGSASVWQVAGRAAPLPAGDIQLIPQLPTMQLALSVVPNYPNQPHAWTQGTSLAIGTRLCPTRNAKIDDEMEERGTTALRHHLAADSVPTVRQNLSRRCFDDDCIFPVPSAVLGGVSFLTEAERQGVVLTAMLQGLRKSWRRAMPSRKGLCTYVDVRPVVVSVASASAAGRPEKATRRMSDQRRPTKSSSSKLYFTARQSAVAAGGGDLPPRQRKPETSSLSLHRCEGPWRSVEMGGLSPPGHRPAGLVAKSVQVSRRSAIWA